MEAITLANFFVILLIGSAAEAYQCGQTTSQNGEEIPAGAWPWHGKMDGYIEKSGIHAVIKPCRVTILAEQFVVTNAHCTMDSGKWQKLNADQIIVKVEKFDYGTEERYRQHRKVTSIIRHEEFKKETFENDIALLKLSRKITYDDFVQPICLWQGDISLNYAQATMPIVSKEECINSYYGELYFEHKNFCAGHSNRTNVTAWDYGSGLYVRQGNKWVLQGIISLMNFDDDSILVEQNSSVILTNVSYYYDWIHTHLASVQLSPTLTELTSQTKSSGKLCNPLDSSDCDKEMNSRENQKESDELHNNYPWLGSVHKYWERICSGVLVHPYFILTAASCVQGELNPDFYHFMFSGGDIDDETDCYAKNFFIHPSYNNVSHSNNIALIKLENPIDNTPISLTPKGSPIPTDAKFTIGSAMEKTRWNRALNRAELMDFSYCRQHYAQQGITLDTTGGQMCSNYSYRDSVDGGCTEDMQSAALQYSKNDNTGKIRYFLAAIFNFGEKNCAVYRFADVFTNVSHYGDWIRETIDKNVENNFD